MTTLASLAPTWTDLVEAFHASTLKRGAEYARSSRVLSKRTGYNPEKGSAWLEAQVLGSSSPSYEVHVKLTPTDSAEISIDASCTCPVNYNCKHAAAALIAHYQLAPGGRQTPQPTQGAGSPQSPAVPLAHQYWLNQLTELVQPTAPAGRTHKLVVQISVNQWPQPVVRLLYGRLNKEGSLTGLTQANSDWLTLVRSPPRYVAPTDVPRVLRLERATDRSAGLRYLKHDADCLREWVQAGQAVVQQPRGHYVALTWGPARRAQSQWVLDNEGRQRFSFAIEPAAVFFAVDGLFYLDVSEATLGPLEADITPELAQVLLRAPAIAMGDVPKVTQQLQSVLQSLPADQPRPPLPKTVATRTLKAKPVVHLRLGSESGVFVLNAQVRYGELAVPLCDKGAPRLFNGELVQLTLKAALHKKVIQKLRQTGLSYNADHGDVSRFVAYDDEVPLSLVHEHIPLWEKDGWVVTLDPSFRWHVVSTAHMSMDTELEPGNDWFSVDLGVEVDGQRLSLLPILAGLLNERGFVDFIHSKEADETRGTFNVRIDEQRLLSMPFERLRTIVRTLVELHQTEPGKPLRLARTDALRLQDLADQGLKWNGPALLLELAQRLKNFTQIAPVPTPAGLEAQLRPYQNAGLAWMQFLREHELAGILADDMGLGKTVQTIAHILTEKNAGRLATPALVVAPTSVVHNWQNELARFAPQLKVLVLHGLERSNHFEHIASSDVVISSYPLLPRDIEVLEKQPFHLAVFDEAQYIKNARTRASEAVSRLRVTHRLALSGTPIENNLSELWSLFHVLLPGFLGDSRRFAQLYRTPIEKQGNLQRQSHLARRIKPFVLRRTKDMVAQELPPKTEINHSVEITGTQRDLYETVRATMEKRVRDALAAKGLAQSHIVVLDALLKLRQVCCDPRLVKSATAKKVNASAKLERLMELLPELIAEGRRILLFSQFTSMLDLIEPELTKADIAFVRLTGQTKDRKTPVARFQKGEVPLFLISLKAGGTGLNLTAADTVIHFDPWWNPAAENQATDRAHRIGQDKPVFVHRLIAAGTVEERIRAMQSRKADLARGILDEDAALAKALTAQDFQALFEPLSVESVTEPLAA